MYLDNHIITLNSTDGTLLNGTYKSNMNFAFTGLLKDDVNIIRTYVTVLNAQIPVSFYVIDENNNLLKVFDGTTSFDIIIPVGNYNSGTLITALNSTLSTAGILLSCSINSVNGRLIFTNSSFLLTYRLTANRFGSTLATILGVGEVSAFSTPESSGPLPYPLNLLGKTKLLINSTNLNNVAYTSFGLGFTTSITTIPVNVPPYSLIQFTCNVDQQKNILVNRVLDNIDIQILDTDNRFINFNNVDWSITLVITIERMDANRISVKSFKDYLSEPTPNLPESLGNTQKEGSETLVSDTDQDLQFLMSGS